MKKSEKKIRFASFWIDEKEFILPLLNVQEALDVPAQWIKIPHSPQGLLGAIELRAELVPVMDLREKLGCAKSDEPYAQKKIAIVNLNEMTVGLCVDATGDILSLSQSDFGANLNSEFAHPLVQGTIAIEDGSRVLQVLDLLALSNDLELSAVLKKFTQKNIQDQTGLQKKEPRRQCITFKVGESQLALDIEAIHEIISVPTLLKSVSSSEFSVGMVDLRGQLIPILDLAQMLNVDSKTQVRQNGEQKILILKAQSAHVGLLVESVDSLMSYHANEIQPLDVVNSSHIVVLKGKFQTAEGSVTAMLDHESLLSGAEVELVTRGHCNLYGKHLSQASTTLQQNRKKTKKQNFITFRLEYVFAVPMDQILEIIPYSSKITHSPGLPKHVCGTLDLRGQTMTIVDLREYYQMKRPGAECELKILITERNKMKFGLIVDNVEEIVSFDQRNKLQIPLSITIAAQSSFGADVVEFVSMRNSEGWTQEIMVLEIQRMMDALSKSAA